ncbi:hypothetical protein [Granulosicoccus antarcticus]|uniref:Uncharacterized protein n=1 Tax=Granulosicoccus antarcticus IMCC3135 TaxID=1192854 RepID=A0A2Z2NPF2_9GAMM|nr:hypothetical protein [Granulosicoccus antarcticus]ASJ71548.1 hypothetical protein IMCC3135_07210 [Granulosicoccus antarcticus IMCC3135]
MGKTYKTLPVEQFLDENSNYDSDYFDDEVGPLLNESHPKRRNNMRGRRKNPDRYLNNGVHTLPSDWFESGFVGGGSQEEWR